MSTALIYARIPRLNCKRLCQGSCGIVMLPQLMAPVEWQRIVAHIGHEPMQDSIDCPMLDAAGQCSVYALRPAICRLWGTVRKMACPHGCEPERWLTDAEAYGIMDELGAV